ncbi:hypothetical protein Cfor_01430, partial [Coptotermes formosanus]
MGLRLKPWCVGVLVCLLFSALGVGLGVPLALSAVGPTTHQERLEAVRRILRDVPLIDGHNDLPWNVRKFVHNQILSFNFTADLEKVDPWARSNWSHTDLPRLRRGMVGAQFWSAYVPCDAQYLDAVQLTLEQIDLIKRLADLNPEHLTLVTSVKAPSSPWTLWKECVSVACRRTCVNCTHVIKAKAVFIFVSESARKLFRVASHQFMFCVAPNCKGDINLTSFTHHRCSSYKSVMSFTLFLQLLQANAEIADSQFNWSGRRALTGELTGCTENVLQPWSSLHDSDPYLQYSLGRLFGDPAAERAFAFSNAANGTQQQGRRTHRVRQACGPRDEPARNDGGSVTRFGTHHEGRSGGQQSPSHFFSLVSLRTVQLLQECSRRRPQTC